jgi:hypothetical protein
MLIACLVLACTQCASHASVSAGRIFKHALIEEQAPCQHMRNLPANGNLLKHDEIGDEGSGDEECHAKDTLPASWHTAHKLAPLRAGMCGQAGKPPDVCSQSGHALPVEQPVQAGCKRSSCFTSWLYLVLTIPLHSIGRREAYWYNGLPSSAYLPGASLALALP